MCAYKLPSFPIAGAVRGVVDYSLCTPESQVSLVDLCLYGGSMAEEEEVLIEIEAVRAVYDEDCQVFESFPPHIHVQIKPRTADDSSQQVTEFLYSTSFILCVV